MDSDIIIEVQDLNMNWFEARRLTNANSQMVYSEMVQAQRAYDGKRVRAKQDGRTIDIL